MDQSNATTNSTNNSAYAVFQHTGVPLGFIVLIFVRFIIAIFGLLFNATLLFVAVNTYDLQGSCNFLIAFNAFCLCMYLPFMSFGVLNHSFVPIQACFWWQLIPMFFGNLFLISTLAIAIDRLLSVLFAAWHIRHNKEFNYLASVLTLCMFNSVCFVYICYIANRQSAEHLLAQILTVLCLNPSDSRQGQIASMLSAFSLIVVSLCIIFNAIIWIIVRKNRTKWNGTFTLKILTSLSVLICLLSFGYLFSTMIRVITPFLKFAQFAYVVFVSSLVSVTAMAANAPVLYIFSTDYQNAFCEHFPNMFKSSTTHQPQRAPINRAAAVTMSLERMHLRTSPADNMRVMRDGQQH